MELSRNLSFCYDIGNNCGPLSNLCHVVYATKGFTPLKHACLTRCRSPLGFLLNEWREGIPGAFIMGLRSGYYCVVWCWALMSLMFVAGVMSLLWMAVIAVFVLVEKVATGGQWVGRASGLLLILWGAWMLMGVLG